MKKYLLIIFSGLLLLSCSDEKTKGKFVIEGQIKNLPDQKIYLEEVYFDQKPPLTLGSTNMVNGKFTISGISSQQGIFRIKTDKTFGYVFINDKPDIVFYADAKDQSLLSWQFYSPANASLKKFMMILDSLQSAITAQNNTLSQLRQSNADSLVNLQTVKLQQTGIAYNDFLIKYIDTTTSPVIALFALGYTEHVDKAVLNQSIAKLSTRFHDHTTLNRLIVDYQKAQDTKAAKTSDLTVGSVAPEITLPDLNGNNFSLSSLRGKYVLVDFWASWCGPCRGENPNVVHAYQLFKDKNFTILGVSLDKEKAAWQQAVNDDGLTWHHVSDLKYWNSEVVPLYNITAIPFNVLLDPQGKIIATELTGTRLTDKLSEVLK